MPSPTIQSAIGNAPAKIILFGEHAVVYRQPAIAIPFNTLTATAEANPDRTGSGLTIHARDLNMVLQVGSLAEALDHALTYAAKLTLEHLQLPIPDLHIEVSSTIPLASGFGSGAATATALIRALSTALNQSLKGEELNALVYEVEKMHHGTPSGIDNTVIVHNAPIYFVRGQSPQTFNVGAPLSFVIANTGVAASTKETVAAVRTLVEQQPDTYQPVIEQIGQIGLAARTYIERGDLSGIGQLMNRNHAHLRTLTVSSPLLDKLVDVAIGAGALGAKLSGGGRGGNMIVLVDPSASQQLSQHLLEAGAAQTWITTLQAG